MKFMYLVVALLVSSCGRDVTYNNVVENAEEQDRLVFSGFFELDGASSANCIYLDEKMPNVVDIESDCQSLVSVNPQNSTLGQFPRISIGNLFVIDGEINHTRNLNFTAGNDIEEDVSGANVLGQRRTDIRLFFNEEKLLVLELKVYKNANNSNLNEIVVSRTFTQAE